MPSTVSPQGPQLLSTGLRGVAVNLTRGMVAWIDPEEAEAVLAHKWHAVPGRMGTFYAATKICEKTVYMHRFVLGLHISPRSIHVDHRDCDGLNNRRSNLRECTPQENARRLRVPTRPGLSRGVYRHGNRFVARINLDGKFEYLGCFQKEEEAAAAYLEAAQASFGEFAPGECQQ